MSRAPVPTVKVPLAALLRHLAAQAPPAGSDDVLLHRFAAERDEAAFQAIVYRHGPLVLDVCRGVLRNAADAEDAFQATFLVLARKADSIRKAHSLGAWLLGTAYRTALKARTSAARRRNHEALASTRTAEAPDDLGRAEARQAVHEEVSRLPARYREAVVLCYLEGRTQDDAGQVLGLTRDGVKKRLERGRELLRAALVRRGLGAAVLPAINPPLPVPTAALVWATTDQAVRITAGMTVEAASLLALAGEQVSGPVRVKVVASASLLVAALVVGFVLGANLGTPQLTGAPVPKPRPAPPDRARTELEGEWRAVEVQVSGRALPAANLQQFRVAVRANRLTARGTPAELAMPAAATIRLDPQGKPKAIDLAWLEQPAQGVTSPGIYQLRDGRLKIALRLPSHAHLKRPAGYATVSGTLVAVTLERVAAQQEQPPLRAGVK